jgi:hypothetical protein
MDLKNIYQILNQLFSTGFYVNNIKIKCQTPADVKIVNNGESVYFSFENNLPSAEVHKFITLKLNVEGVSFGKTGGMIKLKNFPDIPFDYEPKKTFGSELNKINLDHIDIEKEINATFQSKSKRKIASRCLQYAKDWATIASLSGVQFSKCDQFDYFVLKNQCYYFVEEQIKNDKELKYGSFVSIIILGMILPAIIKWAVERVIRSLLT